MPVFRDEDSAREVAPFGVGQALEARRVALEHAPRLVPIRKADRFAEISPYTEQGGFLDDRADIIQEDSLEALGKLRGHQHRDDAAARGADDVDAVDTEMVEQAQGIGKLYIRAIGHGIRGVGGPAAA